MGRYYAMDRDNRWDRVEKAYAAMVYGEGVHGTPEEVMRAMKQNHIYEEAIPDMYRAQLTLEDQGISFEKPFLNIKDAQQSVMDSFEKGEGKHA